MTTTPDAVTGPQLEYRWQVRATVALGDLLARGHARGLAALVWTITENGTLVGAANDVLGAERRATWEGWRAVTNAVPWPERATDGGGTHLHAVASLPGPIAVPVALTADVHPIAGLLSLTLAPDEEPPCDPM